MILDERTYTLHPGKLGEFLAAYEKEGYPVQTRHLGKPFGYFFTEVGTINQIVHMWAYESMADREQKRAAMQADPAWQAWIAKAAPYFTHQENRILKSVPFFPGR
ncbi:MAG: NIPSNAP family protein [Alphaproteobacteria bacterium]